MHLNQNKRFPKRLALTLASLLLTLLLTLSSCELPLDGLPIGGGETTVGSPPETTGKPFVPVGDAEAPALRRPAFDLSAIPAFSGKAFVEVNGNVPTFYEEQYCVASYEYYGDLDALGRCTETVACIGIDIMPTEDRGSISSVKPSGWQSVQYDIVDGKYLYNRCHLIGFQLTGENANKENLVTGTRYLNIEGMLPFENMIADYVKETENHVLFRVIPIYDGDELVPRGVHMEAYSVEDNGDGISFNVFAYNAQPGIVIDYATGLSALSGEDLPTLEETTGHRDPITGESTYILNTNTKKFHYPTCASAIDMAEQNKETFVGTREELIEDGYEPCGRCDP